MATVEDMAEPWETWSVGQESSLSTTNSSTLMSSSMMMASTTALRRTNSLRPPSRPRIQDLFLGTMADDWDVYHRPSRGRVFYYRANTGETSWRPPTINQNPKTEAFKTNENKDTNNEKRRILIKTNVWARPHYLASTTKNVKSLRSSEKLLWQYCMARVTSDGCLTLDNDHFRSDSAQVAKVTLILKNEVEVSLQSGLSIALRRCHDDNIDAWDQLVAALLDSVADNNNNDDGDDKGGNGASRNAAIVANHCRRSDKYVWSANLVALVVHTRRMFKLGFGQGTLIFLYMMFTNLLVAPVISVPSLLNVFEINDLNNFDNNSFCLVLSIFELGLSQGNLLLMLLGLYILNAVTRHRRHKKQLSRLKIIQQVSLLCLFSTLLCIVLGLVFWDGNQRLRVNLRLDYCLIDYKYMWIIIFHLATLAIPFLLVLITIFFNVDYIEQRGVLLSRLLVFTQALLLLSPFVIDFILSNSPINTSTKSTMITSTMHEVTLFVLGQVALDLHLLLVPAGVLLLLHDEERQRGQSGAETSNEHKEEEMLMHSSVDQEQGAITITEHEHVQSFI